MPAFHFYGRRRRLCKTTATAYPARFRRSSGCRKMPYEIQPIHGQQGEIVREFFVNTADDNYIAARWCFVERLNVDFFWLAVHALEKYMKAVLLVNGRSGKGFIDQANRFQPYGHDIEALYQNVQALAPDLLPSKLEKPNRLESNRWREETPNVFMARLHRNGNADNRYQVFGYVRHDDDLFKLDAMVFALRRLCMPLDAYYLQSIDPASQIRVIEIC